MMVEADFLTCMRSPRGQSLHVSQKIVLQSEYVTIIFPLQEWMMENGDAHVDR